MNKSFMWLLLILAIVFQPALLLAAEDTKAKAAPAPADTDAADAVDKADAAGEDLKADTEDAELGDEDWDLGDEEDAKEDSVDLEGTEAAKPAADAKAAKN